MWRRATLVSTCRIDPRGDGEFHDVLPNDTASRDVPPQARREERRDWSRRD